MGICTLQPAPSTSGRSPSSPALLPHGAVPFLLHKESNHGMEAEGGSSLSLAASLGGQVTGCTCPKACELLPGSPELSDEALGTSALLGAQEIKCSQQKTWLPFCTCRSLGILAAGPSTGSCGHHGPRAGGEVSEGIFPVL